MQKRSFSHQIFEDSLSEPDSPTVYKAYKYRFLIVFIFILAALVNAMMWLTFGPLQKQLEIIYDTSLSWITFGTILISNVIYAPGCVLSNFMIDKLGFRTSITFGTGLTVLGLWIRTFYMNGFIYIFIGQCFAGMAQSYFYSTGQKVSAIWFPAKERALATTTIYGLLPLGNAFGSLLPEIFVNPASVGQKAFDELGNLLRFTAYLGTGVFFIILIFFREKPKTPPSRAAEVKRFNLKDSVVQTFKNWNLVLLMFSLSFAGGINVGLGAVFQPLLQPYGINQNQVANIMIITVFVGVVLNYFTGFIIAKTKKYKATIGASLLISAISFFALAFSSSTGNFWLISGLSLLSISAGVACMPSMFEFMVEVSFPIAEEIPGSIFSLGYQLIGTGVSLAIDQIIDNGTADQSSYALYFCGGAALFCFICFVFVKEELRRGNYEAQNDFLLVKDNTDVESVETQA